MNTLCRKPVPGYHEEEVVEPLIVDKDDYKTEPEKWNTILELSNIVLKRLSVKTGSFVLYLTIKKKNLCIRK